MDETPPILFGPWAPDRGARAACAEARGLLRRNGAYVPLSEPSLYSPTASPLGTNPVIGGTSIIHNGVVRPFVGTATKLYAYSSRSPIDSTHGAGNYATGTTRRWQFEAFGDYLYAVNGGAILQRYDLLGTPAGTDFVDVSGAPTGAQAVGKIGDFLHVGTGYVQRWCAFNDPSDWVFDPTTQADEQALSPAAGDIMHIADAGDYGVTFQERAITRWSYLGPPVIYDPVTVEERRGAISPAAVVRWGRLFFFASEDGFFVFDGATTTPIGAGKVDEYFRKRLNYAVRHKVVAAYDSQKQAIVWGYPTSYSGNIDELLWYSLTDGEWTRDDATFTLDDGAATTVAHLFGMATEGVTVEGLPTYFGTTNLDAMSGSIDDPRMLDDRRRLAGVTDDGKLVSFTGLSRPALVETAEQMGSRRQFIRAVWPVLEGEGSAPSCAVGVRANRTNQTPTYTPYAPMNDVGFCPMRVDGRLSRVRLQVPRGDSYERIEGVRLEGRERGQS